MHIYLDTGTDTVLESFLIHSDENRVKVKRAY